MTESSTETKPWESDDLETSWRLLRSRSTGQVVTSKSAKLEDQLELARAKTLFDLTRRFHDRANSVLTTQMLGEVAEATVRSFGQHWREGVTSLGPSALIGIVLASGELSATEIKAFMRALPESLIRRIASAAAGTADGVHALVGLEHARRGGRLQGYEIERTIDDQIRITFSEPGASEPMQFYLDDHFELPE